MIMSNIRSLIEQLGYEKGECRFALSSYCGYNTILRLKTLYNPC